MPMLYLVPQKTQSSSCGELGEAFGGGDGHRSDKQSPFVLFDHLCPVLFFALHMNRLSFHLSFFQIVNVDLGLFYTFARRLAQQRSGLSWGLWILKF